MSSDTMLVTAVVLSLLAAMPILWGDFQTRLARQKARAISQRRRSL